MNVIFLGGPNAGATAIIGDDVTSLALGSGVYVRTSGIDALGRVEFRWVENQDTNAEVKHAALVNNSPPPLNAALPFPYKIDPLPAAALFGTPLASIAPRGEPVDPLKNPARKEPQ